MVSAFVKFGFPDLVYSYHLCTPGASCAYVELRYNGGITAPVVGSGCCPIWIDLVDNCMIL